MGTRSGLDGCGKSCPPSGFDPQTVQPVYLLSYPDKNETSVKIKTVRVGVADRSERVSEGGAGGGGVRSCSCVTSRAHRSWFASESS